MYTSMCTFQLPNILAASRAHICISHQRTFTHMYYTRTECVCASMSCGIDGIEHFWCRAAQMCGDERYTQCVCVRVCVCAYTVYFVMHANEAHLSVKIIARAGVTRAFVDKLDGGGAPSPMGVELDPQPEEQHLHTRWFQRISPLAP